MGKKWERFSLEEIQMMTKESSSIRELGKKLGYSPDSGSAATIVKDMVQTLNLDTTHFTGQGWNKGNFDYSRFKYGSAIKLTAALPALTALKGHKCEKCGLEEWLESPIVLEIHHVDGDHLNNELDNLQLLCPNCHSFTENWRGKNINSTKKEEITDEIFVEALKTSPNIRQALLRLGLTAAGGNYTRARELIHKNNILHLM